MSISDSSSSSVVIPTFAAISSSVGARAERRLELADRPLDLAGPRPHRARHPVERAQLVDDRAADPRDRVGLELDVPLGVVAVDRAHQPEQPVRDEIGLLDVRRQPRAEPPGDVLHERRVVDDQPVAQRLVARSAVLEPEAPAVGFAGHGERIRASGAFSSVQPTRKIPSRARSRPPRPRSPTARGSSSRPRSPRKQRSDTLKSVGIAYRPTPDHARDPGRYNRVATEGRSSIGRAPVSKTGGCRFESCRPCNTVGEPTRFPHEPPPPVLGEC